jgi:hypothetical protein
VGFPVMSESGKLFAITVAACQHDVEHYSIKLRAQDGGQRFVAVVQYVHRAALRFEGFADERRGFLIVFDYEDTH